VRVTIADVAARAGVSKTTVSRVLNVKGDLDDRTAARVRKVIADLGYVPSSGAVGLARGRTRILGVLVPSLNWPWMGDVLQGVVDVVESESYGLSLFTCTRGEESMRQFATQVSAKSFDGLLVIEPEGTLDYIASLHAKGLPVVMIDDRGHQPLFPSVATTNLTGAQDAARHLFETGRQAPVVVSGDMRFGCTEERLAGFGKFYADAGFPIPSRNVVDGDYTFDGGRLAIRSLLEAGVSFDAVFAHNDLSAAGALRALREAGRTVPDDVAIVGFDDIPLAMHTDPPLTTVHQPLRDMGATAARTLLSHFDSPGDQPVRQVLPTTLVVRGSS
jgi:LacI family transcriptional regulator